MSSMTPAINLETALEILAACSGLVTTELLKEQRSVRPNQERIDGYRQVLGELIAERKTLQIDDEGAINRIRFFYGALLKKAMPAPSV